MTVTSGWLSERAVLKPDGLTFRARPVLTRKEHRKPSRTEPVRVEGPSTVTSLPRSTPRTRRVRDCSWKGWNGKGALAALANAVFRNGRLSRAHSGSATRVSPRISLGTLCYRLTNVPPERSWKRVRRAGATLRTVQYYVLLKRPKRDCRDRPRPHDVALAGPAQPGGHACRDIVKVVFCGIREA